jgi:NAD(P)-dependent dehydrogenase (short-subunit alcohol dehydrogenase family)
VGRLDGRVAIVTGAGQGIGRGISLAFAAEGALVIVATRGAASGQSVAEELSAHPGAGRYIECDVADRESVERCIAATLEAHDRIDILVNNAVAGSTPTPLLEQTPETFRQSLETGLLGTLHFMQLCYPALSVRGGSIINLGSAAGYEGHAGLAAYASTKEGIRALTRVAAREWGDAGIRANVLCPFGNSPGWDEWRDADPASAAAFVNDRPLPRVGDCEQDIGRAALFLASDDSAYVTGMTLPVDGGGAMLA